MENNGQKSQLSSPIVGREDENDAGASNESINHTNTGGSSSESETNNVDQELSVSADSESGCGECVDGPEPLENFREHNFVKQRLFSGMGSLENYTTAVAVHKKSYSSFMEQARLQSFKIFSQAMIEKRGGNANIRHACAKSSIVDKEGLRHIMLFHVILGNMEGFERMQARAVRPTSPWVSFPVLISVLSRIFPPSTISMIAKYDQDHQVREENHKADSVQRVRQISGDKLVLAIIKICYRLFKG
ncbi:hypothetical protein HHK36_028146 [Tetracentron sinense]|uniref:RST domain-containing protein n=1 Tax=Tetracentron sinense TaxID=13715 RepID=A0A834YJE4_TETSI|nr:hypothetical protein HHK36_028146 [Tetracentron sinense]